MVASMVLNSPSVVCVSFLCEADLKHARRRWLRARASDIVGWLIKQQNGFGRSSVAPSLLAVILGLEAPECDCQDGGRKTVGLEGRNEVDSGLIPPAVPYYLVDTYVSGKVAVVLPLGHLSSGISTVLFFSPVQLASTVIVYDISLWGSYLYCLLGSRLVHDYTGRRVLDRGLPTSLCEDLCVCVLHGIECFSFGSPSTHLDHCLLHRRGRSTNLLLQGRSGTSNTPRPAVDPGCLDVGMYKAVGESRDLRCRDRADVYSTA